MENSKKEKIKTCIAAGIVILLILTASIITLKYSVEGETNMPFQISKIVIGSMVVSKDDPITNDGMENEIVQNNGIYFEIKKNTNYKKEAVIDSVVIDNIQVKKAPIKGNVKTFIPNTTENKKFTYSNDFILDSVSLTYKGATKSNTTTLEINNQGGIMAIAFANMNLGTYTLTAEDLKIDGTMLNNMDISYEDIKFSVNFDFIINTEGKKYKTNMTLDLPCSDITTEGVSSLEITDTSKYIFKRVVE